MGCGRGGGKKYGEVEDEGAMITMVKLFCALLITPCILQPVPLASSTICGQAARVWERYAAQIAISGGEPLRPRTAGICAINASAAAQVRFFLFNVMVSHDKSPNSFVQYLNSTISKTVANVKRTLGLPLHL
jgi:hypothetical protein